MEKKVSEQKSFRFWEKGYLLILAVYLLEAFLKTTMFPITWPEHSHDVLQCTLAVFVLMKFACGCVEPFQGKKAVAVAMGSLCFLLSSAISEYWVVRDVLLLALGAYGVSFRKILTLYLAVLGTALLVTVAAALTGVIENLIYYSYERRPRISFGVNYPTDFTAYLFFGTVIYCCLRRTVLHWWEIGGIGVLAVFSWYFCDSRNNAGCLLLVGIGCAVLKIWAILSGQREKGYYLPKVLQTILMATPVLIPVVIWTITILYRTDSLVLSRLNELLSNRLALGQDGIGRFGLSLFGQQIAMIGNGMSTEISGEYFFIDSSYILIGLRFGMVVLVVVCLLFGWYMIQFFRREQILPIMLLSVLLLQCMSEHHFFEYVYNPFLLLALADGSESFWRSSVPPAEPQKR